MNLMEGTLRFAVAGILLVASQSRLLAQSEAFEVISLKVSRPDSILTLRLDPAQFLCTHHSLMHFIMSAYPDIEVQPWKLSGGPSWMTTEFWDLAGKLPPNMPTDEQPLYRRAERMLQTMLRQEFNLKFHRQTKQQQVYGLVVAKNGPKLRESSNGRASVNSVSGGLEFRHVSMKTLVSYLYVREGFGRRAADRPVIDMTGLDARYDFKLEWADAMRSDPSSNGPSIFTALQQLGLRLTPQKYAIDFLVVDHAERPVEH